MGYSEEGYAGDLDAAAAAQAAAAAADTPEESAAVPSEPASNGRSDPSSALQAGTAAWWGTSQGTSSFAPPDTDESFLVSSDGGSGRGGSAASWLAGGLRGLFGRVLAAIWPGRARSDDSDVGRDPAEVLRTRAREAFAIHKLFCDQTTAYVADAFGHEELNDKSANQQVAFVERHWMRLDGEAAQELANRGALVVAGLASPNGIGHTAIVTPGPGWRDSDGAFHPNVTNGGSPAVQSDGSRTVADVWSTREREKVRYFTPSPDPSPRSD